MSQGTRKASDTYELFMGTVDVINEALEKHAEKPVLKQVVSLADEAAAGKQFGVAVYKDHPEQPYDYFTLRMNNKKFELEARGKKAPDIAWKVSQDFLEKVCANSQEYVDNPAKLDLDWIKSRLAA